MHWKNLWNCSNWGYQGNDNQGALSMVLRMWSGPNCVLDLFLGVHEGSRQKMQVWQQLRRWNSYRRVSNPRPHENTTLKWDNCVCVNGIWVRYLLNQWSKLSIWEKKSSLLKSSCTNYVDPAFSYAGAPDGILALGRNKISVPSQLAKFGVPQVFGHCFAGATSST